MYIDKIHQKRITFLILLLWSNISFSQIKVIHHSILRNDTNIDSLINSTSSKSILFFCPTAYIKQEAYIQTANELIDGLKVKELRELTIHFIYFKQDLKSNSNGLKLLNSQKKDTVFIGQFECFFIDFDTSQLFRAVKILKPNFDIEKSFETDNIYSVPIVDTNTCFKNIPARIPFYENFIIESIYPNFTTDEKIQFLRDTLVSVQQELDQLRKDFETIKASFPKNNIPIEQGNSENSTIINSNAKPKSGTKGKNENANGKN